MASERPITVLQKCPGCGSERIALALRPNIWACADCGLHLMNPQPSRERIRAYYDGGATYWRLLAEWDARERIWAARLRLVRRYCPGGRLLDVGTGEGHFLLHAREVFAAEGTEVSRAGVELARSRDLTVHHGVLEELALPTASFDVVTLWHVLEHVPQPAATLAQVAALLKPGGHLVLAVPNEQRPFDLCRWRRRRQSPFPPLRPGGEIHLVHFTPRTLRRLLERQGFTVLAVRNDDVEVTPSLRRRAQEASRRMAGWALGRRWSTAMAAVARRR